MDFMVPSDIPFRSVFIEGAMSNKLTADFDFNGLPQDVPQNIPFDGPVNGAMDPIQSDATGLITFNQSMICLIYIRIFSGRFPAIGDSMLVVDTYRNESIASDAVPLFDYANTSQGGQSCVFNIGAITFDAGETFRVRGWTDSGVGNDNCMLISKSIVLGAYQAPSIHVSISQLYQLF